MSNEKLSRSTAICMDQELCLFLLSFCTIYIDAAFVYFAFVMVERNRNVRISRFYEFAAQHKWISNCLPNSQRYRLSTIQRVFIPYMTTDFIPICWPNGKNGQRQTTAQLFAHCIDYIIRVMLATIIIRTDTFHQYADWTKLSLWMWSASRSTIYILLKLMTSSNDGEP